MGFFQLNRAGVAAILVGPDVTAMVTSATDEVADNTRAQLPPSVAVQRRTGKTDRAVGQVTIADVKGMALQANDGVLTKAATAIGAEVRTR